MAEETRVLVVDDESLWRDNLEVLLEDWDCEVTLASSGAEAVQKLERQSQDLVLTDVRMPGMDGLELLAELRKRHPHLPVVLVTAEDDVRKAVEAMRGGAADYVSKDERLEELLKEVLQKLETRRVAASQAASHREGGFGEFIGTSSAMKEVYQQIQSVAPSAVSVLVTGESGTGKELVARTLHSLSPRAKESFIAVNSAAIPHELLESEVFGHEKGAFTGAVSSRAGCFELAHQGTLFLDEIGEMPMALQPKLLRVLEDGRVRRLGGSREFGVDVRVVAATNRSPKKAIDDGNLREDLFFRLNVFQIDLPPLRERGDDMELLADYFAERFSERYKVPKSRLASQALEHMRRYTWPGNVRELRNAMERAVVLAKGEDIEVENLPPSVRNLDEPVSVEVGFPVGTTIADAEKALILKTLESTGNNKQRASELLGVDVKTVRNKLHKYGMA
ncbi:MAG TPA: sigma-54 dependent transcriptional regulator [Acidobacteriota bacterium]|nr:sigma-54 dependent transcriptional regulator [Acidobacteriota bacterium]